jgi:threonylcarbamoyladenosine tRNA methylthiotransferase MtaB
MRGAALSVCAPPLIPDKGALPVFSVAFQTLGCKLNQSETDAIAAAFFKAGFPPASDPREAGLLIINTCAVTSKAEQKGRRLIRAAFRQNPFGAILVTGCYAELNRADLESLDGGTVKRRLFVVPGIQKNRIMDLPALLAHESGGSTLQNILARFCGVSPEYTTFGIQEAESYPAFRFETSVVNTRSRVFLKIQDGCNNYCSYCIVPFVRGTPQSLPAEEALARLRDAEDGGLSEAVLTGVNISRWSGADNAALPELLKSLISGTKHIGLRLSSLEPDVFTDEFFEVIGNQRIRPHFHLSIQAGSTEILTKMKRFYKPEAVLHLIQRLRSVKDDPFISCDIIIGFPGETERHFSETYKFCEAADFARMHIFPFSRRRGTEAWNYTPRVPEREIKIREKTLKTLALQNRQSYIKRWSGRETGGLCLSYSGGETEETGVVLTDNYLKLRAPLPCGAPALKGGRVNCRIDGPAVDCDFDGYGEIVGRDVRCGNREWREA